MTVRSFVRFAFAFLVAAAAVPCLGDVIILKKKDPKTKQPVRIEGKILELGKDKTVIETYPGTKKTVDAKDIQGVTRGKPQWEVYAERKENARDKDGHYKLGCWCRDHGLPNEAAEEWRKVVELAPEHKEARKALGQVKDDKGEWRSEPEVMIEKGQVKFEGAWVPKDKLPELMKKGGYALTFEIAVEDDVDDEFMKKIETRLKETACLVWQLTQGQFYISEVTVTDKTSKGNVIVEKGLAQTSDYRKARATGIGYNETMYVPGEYYQYTFVHEMGHARLGLPDEKRPNQCAACLMCGYSEESVGNLKYCDEANHTGVGQNCWEILAGHWPNLVGPANMNFTDIKEGAGAKDLEDAKQGRFNPPEMKVTIKNN